MWYVYIHFKPNGRPFYVGKGLLNRAKTLARPHNDIHCKILKKYGKGSIKVMMFPFETNSEAVAEEIRIISELRKFMPDAGCDLFRSWVASFPDRGL